MKKVLRKRDSASTTSVALKGNYCVTLQASKAITTAS